MEGNWTVWAKKFNSVKTVEIVSFLLLTHNFLAIKASKFQQTIYRYHLFDPNWSRYPTHPTFTPNCIPLLLPSNHILINFEKNEKKYRKLLRSLYNNQKIKKMLQCPQFKNRQKITNCPETLILSESIKLFFMYINAFYDLSELIALNYFFLRPTNFF